MKRQLVVLGLLAAGSGWSTAMADAIPRERIDRILAMSPTEMATTGAWTTAAYERLMGYLNSIEDPDMRGLVLDMLTAPRSTVFGAEAPPEALRTAPATGGPGHHHYPGGLASHLVENIEIALGWVRAMANVPATRSYDRDLIIAELALHDWAKVWYAWNEETGKVEKPDWYPASWGGKDGIARWGWMGEHGAVLYAELLKRGAPEKLLFGAAAAHFDPQWDVAVTNKEGKAEGLNAALAEAAEYAGVPAPVLDPAKLRQEWFFATYSDGSWSFSHYVAGKSAHRWIREVVAENGIDPQSPEAARLAWFVLTRISDFRLYRIYQDADFSEDAVKTVIHELLVDSSAYEVN